jgi:predicted outer membrane repeat protein
MKKITLIMLSCLIAAALQAQILHVPADYPTIQQGINAANPGDTVLVSDGIYYEQINFKGKAPLIVASQFIMDGNESHIANTIIDGSQPSNSDSASVVYFVSGEDTTSILCGFTIQNGTGTYTPDNLEDRQGGGIWIADAGAKIIHNRITHNTLDDSQPVNGNSTAGAGICGKYAEGDYWVVIQDNTIDSNSCVSKYEYAIGGGICICYNCLISNNMIFSNKCTGIVDASAWAGGICGSKDPLWNNTVNITINHNIISSNEATSDYNNANSGGVQLVNITTVVSDNEVSFNTVMTNCISFGGGCGGLALDDLGEGSVVRNNVISHNVSNCWGGGLHLEYMEFIPSANNVLIENNYFLENEAYRGGAISDIDNPASIQNNVFRGNRSTFGGALFIYKVATIADHLAMLINNSFSANVAQGQGGAVYSSNAFLLIFNNIFWQDTATIMADEIFISNGNAEIAWSDIDTNQIWGPFIAGYGIMNEDPIFEDMINLVPFCYSPCIDQGVMDYTCSHGETYDAPGYDIHGLTRPQGAGVDMGAYDTIFSWEGTENQFAVPSSQLSVNVLPNPTGGIVNCQLSIVECQFVSLKIFDNFGREVATILDEQLQTGKHTVQFDASALPAGIYFYRLTANGAWQTGKLVKF